MGSVPKTRAARVRPVHLLLCHPSVSPHPRLGLGRGANGPRGHLRKAEPRAAELLESRGSQEQGSLRGAGPRNPKMTASTTDCYIVRVQVYCANPRGSENFILKDHSRIHMAAGPSHKSWLPGSSRKVQSRASRGCIKRKSRFVLGGQAR